MSCAATLPSCMFWFPRRALYTYIVIRRYFAEAVATVGATKLQPGLEPNAVLSNPGGKGPLVNIVYILSKGVDAIAVWGPNPLSLAQRHWASLGAFMHMQWPPAPSPPPVSLPPSLSAAAVG